MSTGAGASPRECIVGAGLAGLLAAHAWPRAAVLEAAPAPAAAHRALLRFRSEAVSALTGIAFRRVRVHKSVWHAGAHRPIDIQLANMYARKVMGALVGDRSIWQLDPVDRFIAPESLYDQLVETIGPRIHWGTPADFVGMRASACISTAPMPVVLDALSIPKVEFRRAPITVYRYRVPGADVFQTIYFPGARHSVYRASITGNLLIVEHAAQAHEHGEWLEDVLEAFGIDAADPIDQATQRYGKIAPINEAWRKNALLTLTARHGVYSLGRFATWRNILLDDVVHDISVIKALIANKHPAYDLHRAALGGTT